MKTKHPRYTFLKNGIYYFSRLIPADLEHLYASKRYVKSLRTKSRRAAKKSAEIISARLDENWLRLRMCSKDLPELKPRAEMPVQANYIRAAPTITECLEQYLDVKGVNRPQTFFTGATRNIGYLVSAVGDRPLTSYTVADAVLLRDSLLERSLSSASTRRVFGSICAVVGFAVRENGLDLENPFSRIYLPPETTKRRQPLNTIEILQLQQRCMVVDDEIRRLIALISDTGLRLAEAVGLKREDLVVGSGIPHIIVRQHAHRRLKTTSSARSIPLVGCSFWAASRINEQGSEFCFPKYSNAMGTSSNTASATANKWLKKELGPEFVVHGLRHSFRDRLRNVGAPTELIDQLGGWSRHTIGSSYGEGYHLSSAMTFMQQIVLATAEG